MNAYLKEISDLARIDKVMTTHIARHTFGTLMLEKGFSLEAVKHMMGHTNVRMTQQYAKTTIKKVLGEFKSIK